MIQILHNARVVTPGATLESGWIAFENERITDMGTARPPRGHIRNDLRGQWVLPGFVDIHAHGGIGYFAQSGEPGELAAIAGFHAQHGTTTIVLSVVADQFERMQHAVTAIAESAVDPLSSIVGSHLEGPFLAPSKCGAIRTEALRSPDLLELARLLEAGKGTVRQVTLAPELPGAYELIEAVVRAGVVPAIGHSNADAETTRRAINLGCRLATHLFNAMSGLDHRSPGVAAVSLIASEVISELILDGHHIDPEIARLAFAAAGPERIALVTDSMAAAGFADGSYRLAGQQITVDRGSARTARGALAGSVLTMDAALRYAVNVLGLAVEKASISAATTPAKAIGLAHQTGSLEVGLDADVVVLDFDLRVTATYIRGTRALPPIERRREQFTNTAVART